MSVPHSPIDVHVSTAQRQLIQALADLKTEFRLPDGFSAEVMAEVQQALADNALPDLDLTQLPFLTLDPPGSRDLDQAMFLQRADPGADHTYLVHYAIADVSSFVLPGGALDAETRRRGQTIYTPDGRVPLHPAELSEGAASLNADQIRPAFVWQIELDAQAQMLSVVVQRAQIRSVARLGYAQAQEMLDDDDGTASWDIAGTTDAEANTRESTRAAVGAGPAGTGPAATLQLLKEIGLARITLEHRRGGASLNAPEQEVEHDGHQYRLVFRPALPIESWNAQISLLTGMAAAKLMLAGGVGILRTMPAPDRDAVDRYRRQSVALGKPWPADMSYGHYLRSLDHHDPKQVALIHAAAPLFRGAGYTPFDGELPKQTVQAAVAAPYAHTTAPLRRLVDRFVLSICAALCAGDEVPQWARVALPGLPAIMMAADQLANRVNRAAVDTVEAALLSTHIGEEFDAVVLAGPRSNGNGNGNSAPRSTIQIKEPAVSAFCEGALEPGTNVRVRLLQADMSTRNVLFRPV